jgi:hypothetical protein
MSDIRYYEVRRVPPAALNYVIWRAMSEGRFEPPEEMKAGAEEFAKLDQTDIEALGDFGRRAWAFICEQAAVGTDPAREAGARRAIRRELPCLEDWLCEWLWNVAYRYAMT